MLAFSFGVHREQYRIGLLRGCCGGAKDSRSWKVRWMAQYRMTPPDLDLLDVPRRDDAHAQDDRRHMFFFDCV